MMRKILIVMLSFVLLMSCATSVEQAEKEARMAQKVEKALESRHYKVNVRLMYPSRGRSVSVTSNYSLEVRGDTLVSYLPYFGRAYNLPYGGGKGLNFTAPVNRYEMAKDKKGRTRVLLVTNNGEDIFTYQLEIFGNGQTAIDVQSRNREPISYSGELVMD